MGLTFQQLCFITVRSFNYFLHKIFNLQTALKLPHAKMIMKTTTQRVIPQNTSNFFFEKQTFLSLVLISFLAICVNKTLKIGMYSICYGQDAK